jgi:hypothetical protein
VVAGKIVEVIEGVLCQAHKMLGLVLGYSVGTN